MYPHFSMPSWTVLVKIHILLYVCFVDKGLLMCSFALNFWLCYVNVIWRKNSKGSYCFLFVIRVIKQAMKEGHLPEPYIKGLANAQLLGRAQLLQDPLVSSLTFFLDGAHSPESMEICGKWFCSAIHKANNTLKKNKNNGMPHILSSNGQETVHISDHGVSTSSTRVRSFYMRNTTLK